MRKEELQEQDAQMRKINTSVMEPALGAHRFRGTLNCMNIPDIVTWKSQPGQCSSEGEQT